ncbi:hypothetical protein [Niallia circulans]|uniref:hypothetical protein n=1 Tax=Niallia circulans TaxID=1397 RepID=UPI0026EB4529|nr:hypothetical protein [Niallia circulans]
MSLVTIVEMKDYVSVISDGQLTKNNGEKGSGFQKFHTFKNGFIAITISYTVASNLFDHFKNSNATFTEASTFISNNYRQIKHEFLIVAGQIQKPNCIYHMFTHVGGKYENQSFFLNEKYPIIMSPEGLSDEDSNKFKRKIITMNSKNFNKEAIIAEQKRFHHYVSTIDNTVNDEVFMKLFKK